MKCVALIGIVQAREDGVAQVIRPRPGPGPSAFLSRFQSATDKVKNDAQSPYSIGG